MILEAIKEHQRLIEHIENHLEGKIIEISKLITQAVINGNKLIVFGNGGSASDSQHMVAEFVGRFKHERKSLPAIALNSNVSVITAIANDYGYEKIFERQLEGLLQKNDIVLALSTSGESPNIINAVRYSKNRGNQVISFLGNKDCTQEEYSNVFIDIPSIESDRIQECHILVAHIVSQLVEEEIKDGIIDD